MIFSVGNPNWGLIFELDGGQREIWRAKPEAESNHDLRLSYSR